MDRRQAHERLLSLLAGARSGLGSLAVIHAPAGFGKSTLLRELTAAARAAGADVLTAAGRWDEREFGFGVVVELLEPRLDALEPAERDAFVEEAAAELFTSGARELEPTFDVVHGLYRLCGRLCAERPLAIVVDDADLADDSSLRFLAYIAERVAEQPILIVLSRGSVPGRHVSPPIEEIAWNPATHRFELAPLTADETAERVRQSWAAAPDETCLRLHEDSAGTPFLVDLLTAERSGAEGDAAAAIASWAERRAQRLHHAGPALLRAIAILGGQCELRHAAALAELDADAAVDAATVLAEAGLLRTEALLSFEQPAISRAIEAVQAPGVRAAAHLAAARLIKDDHGTSDETARHLLLASRTGSPWVVDSLCQAAALALGRGAPGEAVDYLRRALTEPPRAHQRAHVTLELGRAEAMAGEPQAAMRLSEAAEWASSTPGDPARALATGRALSALGRPEQAVAVFEHALHETDDSTSALAGQLRAGRAAARWLTELPDGGGRMKRRPPPETADTPGDRALLALHAMEGAVRGAPAHEVRALAVRALARGALLDDETADGLTYYLAAGALAVAEDFQAAEAALTAAVEDAHARGSVLGFATASHVRAMAILMRGRVADAAADARNALAAEPEGWRLGLGGARLVLALTALESGDVAAAERQLADAHTVTGERHLLRISLLIARGMVRATLGDASAAREDFLRSGELAEQAGVVNPAVAPWRSAASRVFVLSGETSEAKRLAEEELGLAQQFGAPGPVSRALRACANASGVAEELELLEAATAVLDGSQAALELARVRVDFGAALRRSGRVRDARSHINAGLALAQACGAQALVERAAREAKAAGARPRRTAMTGPDSLTTRERQVAMLAASGLSNREIANELVVTIKTVEWHLKHSYRKLGVGSRTALLQFFPPDQA